MAQCATTALAGAVSHPSVRGARGRFGGLGPVPGVVSLPFPPSRPECPGLRVAGRPVRVSLTLARWYAIPHGRCVPRARSGCPSGSPSVPFACVCAGAPAASAPPPLVGVACAPRAVPALGAGRAVPRGPCPFECPARSLAPSGVLGRGQSGRGSPVPGFGLCAPRGAAPGGVACDCCEGRLLSDAVPPRAARPLGRVAGVPRPVCPRCGRCGRGNLAPAPQRAPLRDGRKGIPGGGAFDCCEGRLMSGAPPRPTARPMGGLLGSTTHVLWARACACRGPTLSPWPACAVGAACRGGGGGASPGGMACCCCEGRPVSGAVPPPDLWGARPEFRDPCVPGAVGGGVGTQHRFHSVCPCGPALLAVGVAEERLLGGCLPLLRGPSEVWRSPSPDCPPIGRAVGVRHPHAVGAGMWVWGPIISRLACMPCGGCVPRGWRGAFPGGVACHCCEGRLVSGAVHPPAALPLGQAVGVP